MKSAPHRIKVLDKAKRLTSSQQCSTDELPAAECELLARRLVRDDALRPVVALCPDRRGAAQERGVKLDDALRARPGAVAQEADLRICSGV